MRLGRDFYSLFWRPICRKGSLLGLVIGEDKKWVLNPLPITLHKRGMGLVFWVAVVVDTVRCKNHVK